MSSLKKLTKEKVHNRNIDVSLYQVDEDHLLAEGQLIDDRAKDYRLLSGEERPPGKLHFLIIRLLIEIPSLMIEKVEIELEVVPREECRVIEKEFQVLEGLAIAPGFTGQVKKLLGGVKGCTHLIHLITVMAPAILQGFWSYYAQKPLAIRKEELKKTKNNKMILMAKILKDTCYVWRENGPAYKNFKKLLDKVRGEGKI